MTLFNFKSGIQQSNLITLYLENTEKLEYILTKNNEFELYSENYKKTFNFNKYEINDKSLKFVINSNEKKVLSQGMILLKFHDNKILYPTKKQHDMIINNMDKNEKIILYIGASTCRYCKFLDPIFKKLIGSKEIKNLSNIKFLNCQINNFEDNDLDSFIETYKFRSIPKIIKLTNKSSQILEDFNYPYNESKLTEFILN